MTRLNAFLLAAAAAITAPIAATAQTTHTGVEHYICTIGREQFDIGIDFDVGDAVVSYLTGRTPTRGYYVTIAGEEIDFDMNHGRRSNPVVIDLQHGVMHEGRREGHCQPVQREG